MSVIELVYHKSIKNYLSNIEETSNIKLKNGLGHEKGCK